MIRHSTAHLLAYAVKELFPDAQVTIGPVIENGFYYDFSYKRPFTPEDLAAIEKKMAELAKKDEPVHAQVLPRDEAVELLQVASARTTRPRSSPSIPANEDDLAVPRRQVHRPVPRPARAVAPASCKVFKLMKVAGAYWRGDSQQRDAAAHLRHRVGEEGGPRRLPARCWRRRRSATTASSASSSTCSTCRTRRRAWCSGIRRAGRIWQQVEQYMRRVYRDNGYQEVQGAADPRPLAVGEVRPLGELSSENMFTTESEKRDYALKPMNCPGHVQIFNSGLRSYRDLPLRYGEFGACHRNEPSGALHGIMRVRGFTQDDGHIFCTEEQIQAEVHGVQRAVR